MCPGTNNDATRGSFELRDHTADIALYVHADSLEDLFRTAAAGYYAVVGELRPLMPAQPEPIGLSAGDVDALLHDFLAELLFRFETAGTMLWGFEFHRLDATALRATATAAEIDRAASTIDREVKAVTFHNLHIAEQNDHYEVTVILDI